jgi:3-oxoacyl-ACP reductase-like protein
VPDFWRTPDFAEAEHHDAMIVAKLLNEGAKVFRTASDLAEAIGNLSS